MRSASQPLSACTTRLLSFQAAPRYLAILSLVLFSAASLSGQQKSKNPSVAGGSNSTRPLLNKLPAANEPEEQLNSNKLLKKDKDSRESIRRREEWFYKQRSSVNAHIPAGARLKAVQHMQRMMEVEGKLIRRRDGSYTAIPTTSPIASPTWSAVGPAPTTGGVFSPVTGRITAITVDPSDASGATVLIGGAQGGIWRTTNFGQTWTAVGDQNASLAMGSIAFAPGCTVGSTTCVVYAGTGEQAGIGFDIYYGAGVLKSANNGLTWTQTCTTASASCPFIGPYSDQTPFGLFTLGGTRISYIAVNPSNPNMVLVAAQTQFAEGPTEGVYCSQDGGATWSNVLSGEMATFVGFGSSSVAYAALGNTFGSSTGVTNGNGIYKATGISASSTCASIAFTRLTPASLPPQSSIGRIDIGIAASDPTGNTLYASIADAATQSATNLGVFVTTNGGTNWTQTGAPDICQLQCWYDNVVKVDPTNKDIVFLGGAAVTDSTGTVANWIMESTNGTSGGTFSSAIPTPTGSVFPHVDQHAIAFFKATSGTDNGNVIMYLGNDGGIWRTDNAEAASITWININNTPLQLTQFYPSIAINPSNPTIAFGGTQDNGSQNFQGGVAWVDNQLCGDGASAAVDQQIPSTVYIGCATGAQVNSSVLNGQIGSFITATGGINPADNSSLVPPLTVDPSQANVAYFGTTKVYQTVDAGINWTALGGDLVSGATFPYLTTIAVAPTNSIVVYAGADNGQVFLATNVTAGSGSFNVVPGQLLPPRAITAIAVDPSDPTGNTAYVAVSGFSLGANHDPFGHVFKTIDGGGVFADISCSVAQCETPAATDLPNSPVNDLVVDPDVPGTIYAATDVGVFVGNCTRNPCIWRTLGTGLPYVAVLSLRLHEASRTLRAATHGRGMWDAILTTFTTPRVFSISPISANVGSTPSLTLTVNGINLTGGTVEFGGTALMITGTPTDTQIQATIPASLLTTVGTQPVDVQISTTSTSNSVPFAILGASPTISIPVLPTSAPVNSAAKVITVNGANFTQKSTVLMDPDVGGTPLSTTFVSQMQLTAIIPTSFMAGFGSTNSVGVLNPPPGGGKTITTSTVTLPTFVVVSPPPPNETPTTATAISGASLQTTEDTSASTTSPTILSCVQQLRGGAGQNGSYNAVWFKFTSATNGAITDVDTIGSSYDTTLAVFASSGTTLTPVPKACNDDINPGVVVQSQLQNIAVSAGTTYYIFVGSFGPPDPNPIALGGKLTLNFTFAQSTPPDFTLTPQQTNATISAGSSATYTVAVGAVNGFSAAVSFSCTLNAASTTCGANPASVTAGNSSTITVTTVAHQLAPPTNSPRRFGPLHKFLWPSLVLALLAVLLIFARTLRERVAVAVPLTAMAIIVLLQAMGCGGGGGSGGGSGTGMHGTQAGSYTVTISGTSGTITHTTTVNLTVN